MGDHTLGAVLVGKARLFLDHGSAVDGMLLLEEAAINSTGVERHQLHDVPEDARQCVLAACDLATPAMVIPDVLMTLAVDFLQQWQALSDH